MWKEEVDSTNSECRRLIDSLDNLSYIAAKCQTAGRGQGDHTWTSTPGENLTFTYVLKPEGLKAVDVLFITQITTLALLSYLRSKGVLARIKWPNDIWVGDRKICGILIENRLDGPMIMWSIIGVGLNINQTDFPSNLPNPTSLSLQTGGRKYVVEDEMESLHKEICRHAEMLSSDSGRKYLQEEFGKYVFHLEDN